MVQKASIRKELTFNKMCLIKYSTINKTRYGRRLHPGFVLRRCRALNPGSGWEFQQLPEFNALTDLGNTPE
jgi:hypothetical protein